MGRFRLTHAARDDLVEIVGYIALENVDAAMKVSDHLEHTLTVLGDNPEAGRERQDISPGIRSFPSGQYVILYRSGEKEIIIARIIHAARDLDDVFKEGSISE